MEAPSQFLSSWTNRFCPLEKNWGHLSIWSQTCPLQLCLHLEFWQEAWMMWTCTQAAVQPQTDKTRRRPNQIPSNFVHCRWTNMYETGLIRAQALDDRALRCKTVRHLRVAFAFMHADIVAKAGVGCTYLFFKARLVC